jgi:hypothetical protein
MATDSGWIPGRSAPHACYQRLKVQFDADALGGDTVTVDNIFGEFVKAFIDVNTLKATTSTIQVTCAGETFVDYTAPGSPADVIMYPMQDGGVTNANGALTTKNSTPRVVAGQLVFTLASANENDDPAITVYVKV